MRSHYLLLAPLMISLMACEEDAVITPEDVTVKSARVVQVIESEEHRAHDFVGKVESASTIDMGFEVAGRVAKLNARESEIIPAGQLLAQLDIHKFELAVQQAKTELDLAQQELSRVNTLREKDLISVAQQDAARTKVALLKLQLEEAQDALSDASLYAPFDALVLKRYIDNHSNISENQPILRLAPAKQFEVVIHVPEKLVATISADQVRSLSAVFHAQPGEPWPLTVSEYTAEASSQTQTFEVRLLLQKTPDWNLLPGMTADVRVELQSAQRSRPIIPTSALQSMADGTVFVWLWNPNDRSISRTTVTVSTPHSNKVYIDSGLNTGDWIVSAGSHALMEGMTVTPLNPVNPSPVGKP